MYKTQIKERGHPGRQSNCPNSENCLHVHNVPRNTCQDITFLRKLYLIGNCWIASLCTAGAAQADAELSIKLVMYCHHDTSEGLYIKIISVDKMQMLLAVRAEMLTALLETTIILLISICK